MGILEKLEMLDLTEEEKEKAKSKFLATFALISDEEFRSTVEALKNEGVRITKAREIKVISNPCEEITKKFSILDEIHETDFYRQNPNVISHKDYLVLYNKMQYCEQKGKSYKNEDGTYKSFLLDKIKWAQEFSNDLSMSTPHIEEAKPVIDVVPPVTPTIEPIPVIEESVTPTQLDEPMDIKEYMVNSDDTAALEAKTTDFATVRKELEASLQELDNLRNLDDNNFDEISFNNIEPDSYGLGRAA